MTRGDIYVMDFGIPFGSEPARRRPVIVIQSNKAKLAEIENAIDYVLKELQ